LGKETPVKGDKVAFIDDNPAALIAQSHIPNLGVAPIILQSSILELFIADFNQG
jgi:hypothetical protein